MIQKKDVIVINLLRTVRCMLLYLQLDNIVPFILYQINYI